MTTQLLLGGGEERATAWHTATRTAMVKCSNDGMTEEEMRAALPWMIAMESIGFRDFLKRIYEGGLTRMPFEEVMVLAESYIKAFALHSDMPRPETIERARREMLGRYSFNFAERRHPNGTPIRTFDK